MLNNSVPDISFIDKSIQPLLRQIQTNQQFGVLGNKINILPITISNEFLKDQFTLSIPYGNQTFKCDVLFNLEFPELGPDLVFEDETFLADPNANEILENIPSLVYWKSEDCNALMNVIKELISYYKVHQLTLCEKHGSRVSTEHCLFHDSAINAEDVEVALFYGTKIEARFFIKLNLDYSELPYRQTYNFKDMAILMITCQGLEWKRIIPEIQLTEDLKETLHKYKHFTLPPLKEDMGLSHYALQVRETIQERINIMATSFKKKQDFILTLKYFQSGSIVEYDSVNFSQITLLLEHDNRYYLVFIKFPERFPEVKPDITVHSTYHTATQNKFITINKFMFNSNWDSLEMASVILSHIVKNELQKM